MKEAGTSGFILVPSHNRRLMTHSVEFCTQTNVGMLRTIEAEYCVYMLHSLNVCF